MAHSTAAEPVSDVLAGDLARSYNSDTEPAQSIPRPGGVPGRDAGEDCGGGEGHDQR
jgi:hypothetical protein